MISIAPINCVPENRSLNKKYAVVAVNIGSMVTIKFVMLDSRYSRDLLYKPNPNNVGPSANAISVNQPLISLPSQNMSVGLLAAPGITPNENRLMDSIKNDANAKMYINVAQVSSPFSFC